MRLLLALSVLALPACGDDPPPPDPEPDFAAHPAAIDVFEATYQGFATRGARAVLAEAGVEVETEVAREGSCRLLTFENGTCEPPCDGPCVDGACVAPILRSAGVIAIDGLATLVTLDPADGIYVQDPIELPEDLFADDAMITASAPGDQVAGFTLQTTGVPAIDPVLEVDQLTLLEDADTVITWSPAAADARVRLQLRSPAEAATLPSYARIECDGPDTGSLVVPAALAAMFPKITRLPTCPEPACPPSALARYHRAATATADGEVTFTASAETRFILEH